MRADVIHERSLINEEVTDQGDTLHFFAHEAKSKPTTNALRLYLPLQVCLRAYLLTYQG